jgi:hypothetical protein
MTRYLFLNSESCARETKITKSAVKRLIETIRSQFKSSAWAACGIN